MHGSEAIAFINSRSEGRFYGGAHVLHTIFSPHSQGYRQASLGNILIHPQGPLPRALGVIYAHVLVIQS